MLAVDLLQRMPTDLVLSILLDVNAHDRTSSYGLIPAIFLKSEVHRAVGLPTLHLSRIEL